MQLELLENVYRILYIEKHLKLVLHVGNKYPKQIF